MSDPITAEDISSWLEGNLAVWIKYDSGVSKENVRDVVAIILANISESGLHKLHALISEILEDEEPPPYEPLGGCTEIPFPHGHSDSMGG